MVNRFLSGEKFDILHNHLIKSAKNFGIHLIKKTNQDMIFEAQRPDFVLFWDKDINLAFALEQRGVPVFNSARAIALCDDKAKTYTALKGIVPQPETIAAPMSFFRSDYTEFVDMAVQKLSLPLVFKECYGSFGEQVYLCHTKEDILSHISGKPFLLQEFIEHSCGEDIRIEVVGGKCVAAMKRKNEHDFRSNITNGGTGETYVPTPQEAQTAITACSTLGLDFGGVDILHGGHVCEVNSNAHIINIMNCTGIDIAPEIFEMIKSRI